MKIAKVIQKGFTLIEVMIVVAIIGILASIAVPAYNEYVESGRAAEAPATLANLRIQMEQCYQDTRSYTDARCDAFCAPANGDEFFAYDCSVRTANTYTLRATGRARGDMNNYAFTVDQANAKTSTYNGTTGNGCWLTSSTGTCQ